MNNAPIKEQQQIIEKIRSVTNILVTVSRNPSVDDLSAALGLTLMLNKIGKHATAIFSGSIPPAITFLEPNKVFENTIDSLRDFIIALDKEKADHLRYKVDGDVVKIFITPYRTVITGNDLQFSQGDYNVELVLALGVENQEHLDMALAAHGQILHDVQVFTFSSGSNISRLGATDWNEPGSSSLCEMVTMLSDNLKTDTPILDKQIATALLTGIVAATDRFSNNKTSSSVMTLAAQLMAAGADQQLIAAQLQDLHPVNVSVGVPPVSEDFTVSHENPVVEPVVVNTDLNVPKLEKIEPPTSTLSPSNEPEIVLDSKSNVLPEPQVENPTPNNDLIQSTLAPSNIETVPAISGLDDLSDHSYLSSTVAPVNSSMQPDDDKRLIDIFNDGFEKSVVAPSVSSAPVSSDLDTFSSRDSDEAKDAVSSVLGDQPKVESTLPLPNPAMATAPVTQPLSDLPLPPPLPDFSELTPPVVPNFNVPVSSEATPPQIVNDPTQFRIPGQ